MEEATHIKTTTGQIYELDDDGQVIIPGGGWVEIRDFLEAPIPVRKAEVRPVEFTQGFYQDRHGNWFPLYTLDEALAHQDRPQKTFRCVEVTK